MNRAIVNSLPSAERFLIMQTEPAKLKDLTEDELIELHERIRRARNKAVNNYRRAGSARISAKGSRGKAKQTNQTNADRAEVYEEALARVSSALAVAARASARELRDERIAAARAASGKPATVPKAGKPAPKGGSARGSARNSTRNSVSKKSNASQKSSKARSQARRDARG